MAGLGLFLVSLLDDLVGIVKARPDFIGLVFSSMLLMLISTMILISDVSVVLESER